MKSRALWAICVLALAAGPALAGEAQESADLHSRPSGNALRREALVVGWHDEFKVLDGWQPWTASGQFDILRGAVGTMTVVLGKTSMYMSAFKHYRAGVYQDIAVDVDHFPVVAIQVLKLHRLASCDVGVQQYRDPAARDARVPGTGSIPIPGNPNHLAADLIGSGSSKTPGILFIRLTPRPSDVGKKALHVMINVSGPNPQGYADFGWIRFIRDEDVEFVRLHPDFNRIQTAEEADR